jgi:hypothetical protein
MARPVLMILVLGAVLTACSGGGGVSATPPATETPQASPSPTPSEEPTDVPSQTPSEEPTPTPVAVIQADTVAETTVEGLTVRREPGTGGERIGFLSLGTVAFVLAGSEEVDGIPWYRVAGMGLPYGSGCITTPPDQPISCPAFQGWVAGANQAGDPWLAPTDPERCPEPNITTISETGFTWRLVCWADAPITFDAWWAEIPDDAGLGGRCDEADRPGGFLYCQNINYNGLAASPEEGFVNRLALSIDPESGLEMPERGQWIRVTGQFDHPAAAACADLAGEFEDSHGAIFHCRLQFVPSSIEPLGS